MQYTTSVAAVAALLQSAVLASPMESPLIPGAVVQSRTDVASAPAECNFENLDTFVESNYQGNNWCVRGYYGAGDISCADAAAGTTADWSPPYYTQADYPYCACNGIEGEPQQGRRPTSVGIWFKGTHNPQWIDINTSDVQAPDGRCYSYQWADGTVQGNGVGPGWSGTGVQHYCLWLNHTNVPEQVVGFSSRRYVGNPSCPYS
ncbi:hypothetical protein F4778DRAFT_723446 [Xylariomycetidae sp. FL2044]|nr:hypothetical protein F4778DRAFT_723446 [Xylariomycetidae sp. FL2044]